MLLAFELGCSGGSNQATPTQIEGSICARKTMAPLTNYLILATVGVTAAFSPAHVASRPSTRLSESFGFDFAEDSYANTPDVLLGEANYKQWVKRVDENSFLNRKVCFECELYHIFVTAVISQSFATLSVSQYNAIRRVRELDLVGATADAGILSKLEANGLDLATLEELLPVIEEAGLLSVVANNQQLLINGVAPLLVEGAPFLLPVVAGALEAGPSAFYLGAFIAAGTEALLITNNVEVPLVGLPAGVIAGLLLVPLAAVLAAVGAFLSSLKK